MPLLVAALGSSVVLVIVAAVGVLPGDAAARAKRFGQPAPMTPGARAHRRAAISDATSLLDRLILPAGAQTSRTEPAGGGPTLTHPPQSTASGDLVDLHRWWVVPEQPEAVSEFLQSNAPAGSRVDLHGTSGFAGEIKSWVVGYEMEAEPDVLSSRSLLVEVVALPGGAAASALTRRRSGSRPARHETSCPRAPTCSKWRSRSRASNRCSQRAQPTPRPSQRSEP